jgi:hypothetical protein
VVAVVAVVRTEVLVVGDAAVGGTGADEQASRVAVGSVTAKRKIAVIRRRVILIVDSTFTETHPS